MKLVLLSKYRSILILFRIAIGLMLLSFFVFNHCAPLAIETVKISFKVSQLDLIALK